MTSPIAKAIAERLWPVTRSPQTPVEQEMYDIATRFVRGDFDDLLPAYTTEVATVGSTRYLMPSEPLYLADASNLTTADGRIVEWRPTQPPTSWWRMVAVMRERLRAGESVESVAADYGTPEDVVTMLADAPAGRPVLSDSTIEWLCIYTASYFQVDSLADFLDQDDGCGMSAECERKAAELRAWEKWKEKTR